MRRLGRWSVTLGTVAFAALPILAAGCAESQSAAPVAETETTEQPETDSELGDLDDLADDLGAPAEAGSELGWPESGSGLPEAGSALE